MYNVSYISYVTSYTRAINMFTKLYNNIKRNMLIFLFSLDLRLFSSIYRIKDINIISTNYKTED